MPLISSSVKSSSGLMQVRVSDHGGKSAIWRNSLFTDAPEESCTDRPRLPHERHLSLTMMLLSLFHLHSLYLLLFRLVCLDVLHSYVMNMCLDAGVRPVHAYTENFINHLPLR